MPSTLRAENVSGSDRFVSRVIWSECASGTPLERLLIASVIKNRIGHPGYSRGRHNTMSEVCLSKVGGVFEFSCIGDKKNRQWHLTKNSNFWTGRKQEEIWIHCLVLSRGTFKPRTSATAYHDKSIKMPMSWKTNPYWIYELVKETPSFKFYKVTPK